MHHVNFVEINNNNSTHQNFIFLTTQTVNKIICLLSLSVIIPVNISKEFF